MAGLHKQQLEGRDYLVAWRGTQCLVSLSSLLPTPFPKKQHPGQLVPPRSGLEGWVPRKNPYPTVGSSLRKRSPGGHNCPASCSCSEDQTWKLILGHEKGTMRIRNRRKDECVWQGRAWVRRKL